MPFSAPESNPDLFDILVALRFLQRHGDGPEARYRNTEETALCLDRSSPQFMGGFLEMANSRLYRFWGDLTEGLRTGKPQNEIKHTGAPMFAELYSRPERLEQFMDAMSGISAANFQAFADKFDFSRYHALCDIGGDRAVVNARGQKASSPSMHFVVIENLIDDARRENAFGLLMSLNMLIEFGDAFDFTAADFFGWCREAGFSRTEVIPLAGSASAGVAYK